MSVTRLILQILGGLTAIVLILVASSAVFYVWKYGSDGVNTERSDAEKLVFILNWGGIDNTQKYSVVYSSESPIHPMGDHQIFHCIQLQNFNVDQQHVEEWKSGPEKDAIFAQALELAGSIGNEQGCFTDQSKPNTGNIESYFWSIESNGRNISGAKVIMVEPKSKRLLYVSFST